MSCSVLILVRDVCIKYLTNVLFNITLFTGYSHRVLREGGNLVLLLSLQLSALIKKLITSDPIQLQSRAAGCEDDAQASETGKLKLTFHSLLLQSKHRVSLGSTDALIHTYTKRHTT